MKNRTLSKSLNCLAGLLTSLAINGCTKSANNPAAAVKPVPNFGVAATDRSAKPLSAFAFAKTTGKLPAIVTFTSTDQNAKSYSWDFNDGSTSNLPNPQHTYHKGNNYFVTLKVSNGKRCDSTV